LARERFADSILNGRTNYPKNKTLPSNITLASTSREKQQAIQALESKFSLTWHHHEDLKTMELIPTVIHGSDEAKHIGSASIIPKIKSGELSGQAYHDYRNKKF
jgi:hypothetical protein